MQKIAAIIALTTLLTGSAYAEPVVVKNSATPAHGIHQLQLEEMWRAGGAESSRGGRNLLGRHITPRRGCRGWRAHGICGRRGCSRQ